MADERDDDVTLPEYDLPIELEDPGDDGASEWPGWTGRIRWSLPGEEDPEVISNHLGECWDTAGEWVDQIHWSLV